MASSVWQSVSLVTIVFLCIGSVSPEETQNNTSMTLLIPTRDLDLHLKLSPSSTEGIYEQHIAKVSYELLPVTSLKESDAASLPIFQKGITIQVRTKESYIANVDEPTQFTLYPSLNESSPANQSYIHIKGLFLGRTTVQFFIPRSQARAEAQSAAPQPNTEGMVPAVTGPTNYGSNIPTRISYSPQNTTDSIYTQTVVHIPIEDGGGNSWYQIEAEYYISVVRKERFVDHLFIGVIVIIIVLANVGMGCKIDLTVIKEVIRRPIPPGIGLFCQYIIMPLVSILFRLSENGLL